MHSRNAVAKALRQSGMPDRQPTASTRYITSRLDNIHTDFPEDFGSAGCSRARNSLKTAEEAVESANTLLLPTH